MSGSGEGKHLKPRRKMALQVRLKRSDRVYKPGDTVSGVVVCMSEPNSVMSHSGIKIKVTGVVQVRACVCSFVRGVSCACASASVFTSLLRACACACAYACLCVCSQRVRACACG